MSEIYNEWFEDDFYSDLIKNNYRITDYDDYKELNTMCKLKKIIDKMEGKDLKKEENEYFSKFGCKTEKEKLLFENNFLINKMETIPDDIDHDTMAINKVLLKIMNTLLSSDTKLSVDMIKKIKQSLLVMELEFDVPVSFYSEIEDLYNEKKENKKSYKKRM